MKKQLFAGVLCLASAALFAQPISIQNLNTPYYEHFDSLSITGTSSNMIAGWLFSEAGTNANGLYGAGTGSSNTGDTYSFGPAGVRERALGSLSSGTLQSTFGAYFVNNTTSFITSVNISFMMEQWRRGGNRTTADSSIFSFGINNGNLRGGTYNRVSALDLFSRVLGGTGGAVNGNDTAFRRWYEHTINLVMLPGDTLYIKWEDRQLTGGTGSGNDGLAIDSFTLTAFGSGIAPVQNVVNFSLNQTDANNLDANWQKPSLYNDNNYTTMVFAKQGNNVTIGNNINFDFNSFTANATFGNGSKWPNDTLATCVYKGDLNSAPVGGLQPLTSYTFFAIVVRESDTVYSSGVTASINMTSGIPAPLPVSSLVTSFVGSNNIVLSVTQPANYNNATHTTLVFIKQGSAIVQGTPTANPDVYIGESNFALSNSRFQNDTAARCVMNSDSLSVNISGLNPQTIYHALVYVVRNDDSAYSVGATLNRTTLSAPLQPVTNIAIAGTTTTTARITWTKPSGYINNQYSTLVFVKADNAINQGTINLAPVRFLPNTSVIGNGTRLPFDTLARCVFRADTNFVNITNMVFGKTYHIAIYVARDADSVYSTSAIASGTSLGLPPVYPIGACVKTNTTTGLPDSNNVRATFYGIVYGINQRTTGLQFVVKDATGGITLNSSTRNFGYTVTEGDSVMIAGTVGSNRGLAVLNNPDTVLRISQGNSLRLPVAVTKLDESTENKLVFIQNLRFIVKPTNNTWPTNNSLVATITPANDTISIRVPNTSALAGKPIPTETYFDIIGLGSQISTSIMSPFAFNGYQINPRVETDIIPNPDADSLRTFGLLSPGNNLSQTIQGDTSNSLAFAWNAARKTKNYAGTVIYYFQLDRSTGNFSSPVINDLSNLNGTDTSYFISFQQITDKLQLTPGVTTQTKWRVAAQLGTYVRISDEVFNMPLIGGTLTIGLDKYINDLSLVVYPNPANEQLFVTSSYTINVLKLYDYSGKEVLSNQTNTLNTAQLQPGMYILHVHTPVGIGKQKVTITR